LWLLRYRLLSALVVVSLAFGFVALDANVPLGACRGVWMAALAVFLMYGSAIECAVLLRQRWPNFDIRPGLLGCAGIMLATLIPVLWPLGGEPYPIACRLGPLGWPLAAAAIALVGCFVWILPTYQPGTQALEHATASGWLAVYFGIAFAFWIALRQTGEGAWGLTLAVGLIVVIKFTDAGAYFAGRTFGRRKLSPAVSPGKTVEGLMGGVLAGALVSWLYFSLFVPWLYGPRWESSNTLGAIALGVVVTFAGLFGDLLESIVKRESGSKDSGQVFPGLGGLWDITDSLLPAGVVAYLMVIADLLGHPK
jgi:phosphatidate cytidylyltransferase